MEGPLKILVVDDQKVIRDLFEFVLSYSGYDITAVSVPETALEVVQQKDFDIVFMDIVMPDMDGVELLKAVKRINKDLPVIMMSGYSLEDKKKEALEHGAVSCLTKPFEIEDIKKAIKEVID